MSEWTDRQYRMMYDGRVISKVVGVTHEPGYPGSAFILMKAQIGHVFNHWSVRSEIGSPEWDDPDSIGEMIRRNITRSHDPELVAGVLIRNPDNTHDPSAIEVHVPLLECRVGFLPTRLAAELAPELDTGERYVVQVWAVRNLDSEEHPGIRVLLTPAWLEDARRVVEALDAD